MSPVDRLEWMAALALVDGVPSCAWRVAAIVAMHANSNDGRAWPGLRGPLGKNASNRGAAWLISAGWLRLVASPPGRPAVYAPVIGSLEPVSTVRPVSDSIPVSESINTRLSGETPPVSAVRPGGLNPETRTREYQGMNQGGRTGEDAASDALTFPTKAGETWTPSLDLVAKLAAAYPDADVDAEMLKASVWCEANPGKRKTAHGMPRFLTSWMARAGQRQIQHDNRPESNNWPEDQRPTAEGMELARQMTAELRAQGKII